MRVNTRAALDAFLSRSFKKPAPSIWSAGATLHSYSTEIARYQPDGTVAFNGQRYSVTTTIHQNALRAGFAAAGLTVAEYATEDAYYAACRDARQAS